MALPGSPLTRGAPGVREHRPRAGRYPRDREGAVGRGAGVAAVGHDDDRRRHLGVEVAVDVDHAGRRELRDRGPRRGDDHEERERGPHQNMIPHWSRGAVSIL